MPISTRFWHTGPAVVFRVVKPLATILSSLATPASYMDTAVILGTCEKHPKISTKVIREEVRNDIGGDSPIGKPKHGEKMVVELELNMWDEAVLDAILALDSGGGGVRTGYNNVLTLGTMTDIVGNSARLFIYYPDETNRTKQGILIPQATIDEHAPLRVGNRVSAHKLRFESNTCISASGGAWASMDYYEYTNADPDVDATLKPKIVT